MSTRPQTLVERFYNEVWNQADETVAREILAGDFRFRGSLGPLHRGPDEFIEYMRTVHETLADYACIIEDLVTGDNQAAARMTFKGRHRAPFFGVDATDREIEWAGAAFFRTNGERIVELWVLGDVAGRRARRPTTGDTVPTSQSPALPFPKSGNRGTFTDLGGPRLLFRGFFHLFAGFLHRVTGRFRGFIDFLAGFLRRAFFTTAGENGK
jgi:predicted ester cyclase